MRHPVCQGLPKLIFQGKCNRHFIVNTAWLEKKNMISLLKMLYLNINHFVPQDAAANNPCSNKVEEDLSETKVIETKFGVKPTYQRIIKPPTFNPDGFNEAQDHLFPKFMVSIRVRRVILSYN